MSDDLRKIQMHIRKYQDAYVVLGTGIVIGLALGSILQSKPKIDEAAIVYKWMEEQVKNGFNIYALTNEQKGLWEACWDFALNEAKQPGWTLPMVIAQLTDDYIAACGPSHPLSK